MQESELRHTVEFISDHPNIKSFLEGRSDKIFQHFNISNISSKIPLAMGGVVGNKIHTVLSSNV